MADHGLVAGAVSSDERFRRRLNGNEYPSRPDAFPMLELQ
jgi:hypothetical protein